MIVFISIAAAMIVVALVWLLVPLLKGTRGEGIAREASNVAILRDQLAELDNDVANGVVPREQYEAARRELERRVLEESKAAPAPVSGPPSSAAAWTAAVLGGALPIAAAMLYFALGSHEAFGPAATQSASAGAADAQHELTPQKVAEMAATLAARLEKEPDNAEGWAILARTYYSLKRFPEAAAAYERAVALIPDNADLLADYADTLGSANNSLDGKPTELINRALKVNPNQWKALALAGTVAFNHKDYTQAVAYWEQLKTTLPPESDMARSVGASIAEARELGGIKTAAVAPSASPASAAAADPSASVALPKGHPTISAAPNAPSATAAAPNAAAPAPAAAASAAPGAAVSGTVTLSPTLAKTAAPEDTVFVIARAVQGPKFPLAIMRKQVKDLPLKFSLDDSMAMAPEMKMSNFADVIVAARVTKSGEAMPQSGDLEGASKPVKLGANGVNVVIDSTRP